MAQDPKITIKKQQRGVPVDLRTAVSGSTKPIQKRPKERKNEYHRYLVLSREINIMFRTNTLKKAIKFIKLNEVQSQNGVPFLMRFTLFDQKMDKELKVDSNQTLHECKVVHSEQVRKNKRDIKKEVVTKMIPTSEVEKWIMKRSDTVKIFVDGKQIDKKKLAF